MIKCQICQKECRDVRGLSSHIVQSHKILCKEYYNTYLKKEHDGICLMYGQIPSCKRETKFHNLKDGYSKCCSSKCVSNLPENKRKQSEKSIASYSKNRETCLKKYDVDHPMKVPEIKEKVISKVIANYGGIGFSSPSIYQSIKDTIVHQYGVDHPMKVPEIKEKFNNTVFTKYNTQNVSSVFEFKEKRKYTHLAKYGVTNISKLDSVKAKKKERCLVKILPRVVEILDKNNIEILDEYSSAHEIIEVKCKKCQTKYQTSYFGLSRNGGKCPNCFPRNSGTSNEEKEVLDFIKSLGFKDQEILENSRKVVSKELDIYIPELKVAIEYDGLYWHSDKMILNPQYHLNKTLECEEREIRLIHIFSDEWNLKQDIVKSRLKQILNKSDSEKIHARKCQIKEIDSNLKNTFLENFHIQGKDSSAIKIGAFYNDKLISVMTFSHGNISKGSKSKENVWELNRFCTNSNYHTPGIAGKLLSYFKRNFQWKEIYSYADRRWSRGDLYYQLGFMMDHVTKPNYWYTKDFYTRIHRFNLKKRPNEPKDISESILRFQEGYSKIWDCGSLKFIIKQK